MASSLILSLYGLLIGAYGIMLLNLCFVMTNLLGLGRVWIPYMRSRTALTHDFPTQMAAKQAINS
ncbi:hypothetical protein D3C84_1307800 [compost metagenome]